MKAEEYFNNGFGEDCEKVHRNHVIELMTNFAKYYHNEQLILHGVSNWVAIESKEQPERVTDVMVKYKDNKKEVAFFDGDGRFYTQNDDDITDKIVSWHKLP